jgi:NDP-4-keto-2,6-dideoxyhexose 3-C-methyltransferase
VTYTTIAECRGCGWHALDELADFGALKVNAFPRTRAECDLLPTAPLRLVRCAACTLVQLADTVDPALLFEREYGYRSATNETMVAALRDVVDDTLPRVTLLPGDFVLDVGANDGTLLGMWPFGIQARGYEPSPVRPDDARIHHDYFPPRKVVHVNAGGLYKVITSVAQLYNSPDLPHYFQTVREYLHPDGVFVAQFQDLGSMVDATGIDNLCAEHLTFFDLHSIARMGARHGLVLDDWSRNQTNGGSFRVFFRHTGKAEPAEVPPPVRTTSIRRFLDETRDRCFDLFEELTRDWPNGGPIYGLGASTKWNTLQQMWGIGPDLVSAIADRNPEKHGRFTVNGTPIISEERMREERPPTLLCCSWQFSDAFARRERTLLERGTRLVVPLPTLRVLAA